MAESGIYLFRKHILTIIWSILILVMGLLPKSSFPDSQWHIPHMDKLIHAGQYLLWMIIYFYENGKIDGKILIFNGLFITFLLGMFIETLQGVFLASRSFEIWDIVANIIGSIIGIYFYRILKPYI